MLAVCQLHPDSERAMRRLTIVLLSAMAAGGTPVAAEAPAPQAKPPVLHRAGPHRDAGPHRAAAQLPAGLPRPHYVFRTTVAPDVPPYPERRLYVRRLPAEPEPELLFTPTDGAVRSAGPLFVPLVQPGSLGLPGYYGSSHSYEYQGPYYGGPYTSHWFRLPYACGVLGYC
jgi:hypothetical protein